jgi:hypothetical protein
MQIATKKFRKFKKYYMCILANKVTGNQCFCSKNIGTSVRRMGYKFRVFLEENNFKLALRPATFCFFRLGEGELYKEELYKKKLLK